MGRYLVTSALPYANGTIHFGHVVGAYLPADIYVRYLRLRGEQVMFVCGTDEHGIAITINAEKEGVPYRQFVDRWHGEIKQVFDRLDIAFDVFSGTARNEYHRDISQHFFRKLQENGYVIQKDNDQWFCEKDDKFLADRYIEGTCPNCGSEDARGDECKKCGQWLDALELKKPRCSLCGSAPVIRTTTHWYLDLPRLHQEHIGSWFSQEKQWKPNVQTFVSNMLKDLHERPITRDMKWGVPLPSDLEGGEGKVLYVWFDAPIGYISMTEELCDDHPERWGSKDDWWKSEDTRLVHFIGKDNIPFHCIVFPAMLYGVKEGYQLPWNVPAMEFYNLQGRKFSTSEGWYLDLEDFFSKYPKDVARYALAATMPETADSEFTWEEFQRKNNEDLADTLGNLASRVLKFIASKYGGKVPAASPDENLARGLAEQAEKLASSLESFRFRQATQALMAAARHANQAFDEKAPWKSIKTDPDRCAGDIGALYDYLWSLAILARPFIPDSAAKLAGMMGLEVNWDEIRWEAALEPPPRVPMQKVGDIEILFTKIEDKQIQEEIRLLHARASSKDKTMDASAAADAHIQYEDFTKVKLKVGKVLSAEPVPKAKKLLELKVDLGEETRQILAGIASSYAPEDLPGKLVVVVSNLAPKKMMGRESQGMILAATGPDGPILVHPGSDLPPGSEVK